MPGERSAKGRALFPVVTHVAMFRDHSGVAELFLLRRAQTGFMDGFYGLPGGHQDVGESVQESALRECHEEAGVIVTGSRALAVLPYISGRHQGLNFVFEATSWDGVPDIAEPELFDAAGWFALDRLPDPHATWLADVLELRASNDWYREMRWS